MALGAVGDGRFNLEGPARWAPIAPLAGSSVAGAAAVRVASSAISVASSPTGSSGDATRISSASGNRSCSARKRAARVSKSGQKILRARIAGDGPLRYRYDKGTGRLDKLNRKAYKAVVAKAAKAARAHF